MDGNKGNLFSWCAVVRFKDQLCPLPWRVPVREDSIALYKVLGGTGKGQDNSILRDEYLNKWGGAYNEADDRGSSSSATYWLLSEESEYDGYSMGFYSNGYVGPYGSGGKNHGQTLRCVRYF